VTAAATGTSPVNHFGDNTRIGVQGQHITVNGPVSVGQESAEQRFEQGVRCFRLGAAEQARTLIWEAIARGHQTSEVLFYWLLSMLSERSVMEFSPQEREQLTQMRPVYTAVAGDEWADGIRILSGLLDLALPGLAAGQARAGGKLPGRDGQGRSGRAELAALKEALGDLPPPQRDLIRLRLAEFLSGPELDALWEDAVQRARARQLAGDRSERVWMYYEPVPEPVPPPEPEPRPPVVRWRMAVSGALLAASVTFAGIELLWHGTFGSMLALVVAVMAGLAAAEADLRQRTARFRHALQWSGPGTPIPPGADTALLARVDKLFQKYINKHEPDRDRRRSFKNQYAERLWADRCEIIDLCHRGGGSADGTGWLIEHRVRRLLLQWRNGPSPLFQRAARPRLVIVRATGLVLLVLGGGWAIASLRAYPLTAAAVTAALVLTAVPAWRCWLTATTAIARFRARAEWRRQWRADAQRAFEQWRRQLDGRPTDEEMGAWLESDQVILLDTALRHFHLNRSRLLVHAFLRERAPWARTAHSGDGQAYAERYQILIFLLVEEGIRIVRASLDASNGSVTIRERRDFRYDSIVAVRVTPVSADREQVELQLASGSPITLTVRIPAPVMTRPAGAGSAAADNAGTADDATAAEGEESPLEAASMASTLHMLEGIAAEGRAWLSQRTWTAAMT
jgi:hypothetical protein